MQIKRLCVDDHLCLVDFEINFNTIYGGSFTILIGENGTGKSTMLETILEIFMSFDSPRIEKEIDYNYLMEFEYSQCTHSIIKDGKRYRITSGESICEGSYNRVKIFAARESIFPQRIIAFYSGANNKMAKYITRINRHYRFLCMNTLRKFLKVMNDDSERFLPNFSKRKYNYCDEALTPIYLTSILCGSSSVEKDYLMEACHFESVEYVDMIINIDKVERVFGRGRFEGNIPTGLYYLTDFIDHRFTELLRSGFLYTNQGKSVFEIKDIDSIAVDSIAILEFFEKLYTLFGAQYEVTVRQGESSVKCSKMSEGQRQLIKILGMLGICKSEDGLVLMDEPDAHMNPKWKYGIRHTVENSLKGALNTQAIIATHDPLVINGLSKEFIRIFTHNQILATDTGYYITKVIAPKESTEGLGIDGLLQSEYYGLPTVLDSDTKEKMDKRYDLLVKKIYTTLTETETKTLMELTDYLENLTFTRNIPTDGYYDEYVAAMHQIYRGRPKVTLTAEDIEERNAKAEEILRGLLEK